ncbi:hypothetical protein BDN72DRAFT_834023 [Pluteus cervinus]|uniref:Uncharacterized protein n=1 Tax=Pluteus cervinus TaxID=181527 RepID=A0ACD3B8K9_9AGAR|nr:hypothetical protein BDN72DRAFT_834023 [Pluteus cervinus]
MSQASFPLRDLPTELLDKVVQMAVSPARETLSTSSDSISKIARPFYTTPLSLAQVSSQLRSLAIRHLLHTVVLSTPRDLKFFLAALNQQESHKKSCNRLHVDYGCHIKRFWCSYDSGQTPDQPADEYPEYDLLYQAIANASSVGLGSEGFPLLYNRLGWLDVHVDVDEGNHSPPPSFSCSRVTFAGFSWRWRPLIHSYHGLRFLEQITHLTLWFEELDGAREVNGLPSWIQSLPLNYMPNLTHLAIPLLTDGKGPMGGRPSKMLVYTGELATDFLLWGMSPDPINYGVVVDLAHLTLLAVDGQSCTNWGEIFAIGEDNSIWCRANVNKRKP